MPTKREREYYRMGFADGYKSADVYGEAYDIEGGLRRRGMALPPFSEVSPMRRRRRPQKPKKKRTLSKWQKFMKSPKSQIKIKRGKDKGKLNLKAMGKAYRKQERGKK